MATASPTLHSNTVLCLTPDSKIACSICKETNPNPAATLRHIFSLGASSWQTALQQRTCTGLTGRTRLARRRQLFFFCFIIFTSSSIACRFFSDYTPGTDAVTVTITAALWHLYSFVALLHFGHLHTIIYYHVSWNENKYSIFITFSLSSVQFVTHNFFFLHSMLASRV